jgi:ribosomal protein S18 acetylase RimI-like enzyme
MKYRTSLKKSDIPSMKEILVSSGFFYDTEVEIALELALENLHKGAEKSGYNFILAEELERPLGFACFGPVPGTQSSYDLYWIAVHKSERGKGIGTILMNKTRETIKKQGGQNIWIETSSRPLYAPTRQFYRNYGCEQVAEINEFYGEKDNKIIFGIKSS